MSDYLLNQYTPDNVSPPGDTLLDILEEQNMSQAELARRMGRPTKTINEIIRGKAAITSETALQLERVLSIPADFWASREQNYRQYLARVEEKKQLRQYVTWANQFPLSAMTKLGWIEAIDDPLRRCVQLLHFFSIASPNQWETIWDKCLVNYRKAKSFESSAYALSAWLRQGERIAQEIYCHPFNPQAFRELLMGPIRSLTQLPPEQFQDELVRLSAEVGVAVVFLPQIPGARVSGATRWLSSDKALIQLSLRYKKDDHFWFTFFHEAGHILLHGKRDLFLETEESGEEATKEQEADSFAANTLIPPDKMDWFLQHKVQPGLYPSQLFVQQFAQEIGVSPGIVVGRLQHDQILPYTHLNGLKQTFVWGE